MGWKQLWAKKSLDVLLADMAGDHRLKRALGPVALTSLGVGAVIGAGIFVSTGAAANSTAGPALMISYMVAGVTCIFAALCYAEFASMAPVAGSAYTYAYTTMGELFAWIIGWDLILEYAVGAATVANGWSSYFQNVLGKMSIVVPLVIGGAPHKYDHGHVLPNVTAEIKKTEVAAALTAELTKDEERLPAEKRPVTFKVTQKFFDDEKNEKTELWIDGVERSAHGTYWILEKKMQVKEANKEAKEAAVTRTVVAGKVGDAGFEAKLSGHEHAMVNLPAILITLVITLVLVKGISESANFNALMVFIKVFAVLFVIVVGVFYINPANYEPFAPYGWTGISFFGIPVHGQQNAGGEPIGMLAGAAIIFFAYIGFDSVSTHAEEAKNPQRDVPIGIIASLIICTILYIAVVAVLTGMVPYQDIDKGAGVSSAFKHVRFAEAIISAAGVAGITSVLLVMMLSAPRVFLAMARDGLVPKKFFADVHPKFQTPWKSTIAIGIFVSLLTGFLPIDALLHLTNIGTLFAFVIVCAAVLIMRRINPTAHRPFRCPLVPVVPILGIGFCLLLMLSLPAANWWRLFAWLTLGLVIYALYGRFHSTLGKELRGELSRMGASPAGTPKSQG
jgi:APA family basic amino acid/polyamine antiporter